jgi:hypothetical protein
MCLPGSVELMGFVELMLEPPVFILLVVKCIFELSGVLLPATGSTLPRAGGVGIFTRQSCIKSYAHNEPPFCYPAAPKKATTRPADAVNLILKLLCFILSAILAFPALQVSAYL